MLFVINILIASTINNSNEVSDSNDLLKIELKNNFLKPKNDSPKRKFLKTLKRSISNTANLIKETNEETRDEDLNTLRNSFEDVKIIEIINPSTKKIYNLKEKNINKVKAVLNESFEEESDEEVSEASDINGFFNDIDINSEAMDYTDYKNSLYKEDPKFFDLELAAGRREEEILYIFDKNGLKNAAIIRHKKKKFFINLGLKGNVFRQIFDKLAKLACITA
ncbi:hypothetical protein A0H76_354 [Hepatospora eriocheir]|uniref:Uncharacterized protein n=1 Tax=Hepatospora eriocheir TaxID=1081669 RepID=A0A1X0QL78_9MICR|nr:hypothetical protein A0H76_354 [Hepatospora eriocheir]